MQRYCFFIGDERTLDITASQITRYIGGEQAKGVTAREAFESLMERWNVVFLLIDNRAAKIQSSKKRYSELLGTQNVIPIRDGEEAPAVIVSTIASMEGTVDEHEMYSELVRSGFTKAQAGKAVASFHDTEKNDDGHGVIDKIDDGYGDLDL